MERSDSEEIKLPLLNKIAIIGMILILVILSIYPTSLNF